MAEGLCLGTRPEAWETVDRLGLAPGPRCQVHVLGARWVLESARADALQQQHPSGGERSHHPLLSPEALFSGNPIGDPVLSLQGKRYKNSLETVGTPDSGRGRSEKKAIK